MHIQFTLCYGAEDYFDRRAEGGGENIEVQSIKKKGQIIIVLYLRLPMATKSVQM